MTRTHGLAVLALVVAGCLVMVVTRAFLFGEAGELLVDTLEHGVAYRIEIARLTSRPAMWLPVLPMIALSYVTSELRPLVYAFGLGHALIPIAATAGVVWGMRHRDGAAGAMAIMGVTLFSLEAPVFVVSSQIAVSQLFWVVLVGLVNWDTHQRWRAGTLGLAGLLLAWHPVAGVYVGATGLLLIVRATWLGDSHVARFRIGVAFAVVALLRAIAIPFSAEVIRISNPDHPSMAKLIETWLHPQSEWMVVYFVAILAAAACLATRKRWSGWVAAGMVLVAAMSLEVFWWATGVMAVRDGTVFLAWILFAAPVAYGLFLHTALRLPAPSTFPVRALGVICAAMFACVVVRASLRVEQLTTDLHQWAQKQPTVCIAKDDVPSQWRYGLGGRHAGFEFTFLASGNSSVVTRVVLPRTDCPHVCENPVPDPHPLFWLDLTQGIRPPAIPDAITTCSLSGAFNELH